MPALKAITAAFIGALALASSTANAERPRPYEGMSGVIVVPRTQAELDTVLGLAREVLDDRVGIGPLRVILDADGLAALGHSTVAHEVAVGDLQGLVDAEHTRLRAPREPIGFGAWFDDFKDLAAIQAYMDDLVAVDPSIARIETVGDSLEGRSITALRIGDGTDRPTTVITAAQHAREWISPMVSMCLADALIRDYGSDPEVTALVDSEELIIVPVSNPDAYELTWNGERYWRKNTRPPEGVDLNRNWSFDWGDDEGSSDDPESSNYRGTEAFSEPETAALRDYMLGLPGIDTFVDLHSFGQYILFPYGCRSAIAPDHDEHEDAALGMFAMITGVHGSDYTVQAGNTWYPACGVAPDWTYDALQALSFTIELRPSSGGGGGGFENGFSPDPAEILTACEEVVPSVVGLARGNLPDPPDDPGTGTGTGTQTGTTQSGGGSTGTETGPTTDTTDGGGAGSGEGSSDDDGSTELPPGDTTATTGDDEEPKQVGELNDRGCSCGTEPQTPAGALAFVLPLLALRRRR